MLYEGRSKRILKKRGYRAVNLELPRKLVSKGPMDDTENGLSPPQRLAVAYAPIELRPLFSLLLEFDARLGHIVTGSSEPLIGQMKLAWWRDAIAAGPGVRPKGEPLMARLDLFSEQEIAAALLQLVDAWEIMLVREDIDVFAEHRGRAVFSTYSGWAGSDVSVDALGAEWAARSIGTGVAATTSLPKSRNLRPLTILALSVRDVSGPRLLWHALTGR